MLTYEHDVATATHELSVAMVTCTRHAQDVAHEVSQHYNRWHQLNSVGYRGKKRGG